MTRMPLDNLKTLVGETIPDNITGLISPLDVRSMMEDIIDSSTPAYAFMWGDHTASPITKNVTTSWSVLLGASMYPNVGVSDPTELNAIPSTGSMPVEFPNYVHTVRGSISLSGPTNRELEFAIGHDGVPIDGVMTLTLTGPSKQQSMIDAVTFVARSGWNLQLLVRFSDGGASADISVRSINMQGTLEPTHSAN